MHAAFHQFFPFCLCIDPHFTRDALDEGERGWPDLVLDERTCVVLKPLSLLRSDIHLNQLTHQVALLSQQCTACYIILYSNPAANSGSVIKIYIYCIIISLTLLQLS